MNREQDFTLQLLKLFFFFFFFGFDGPGVTAIHFLFHNFMHKYILQRLLITNLHVYVSKQVKHKLNTEKKKKKTDFFFSKLYP